MANVSAELAAADRKTTLLPCFLYCIITKYHNAPSRLPILMVSMANTAASFIATNRR